MIKKLFKWLWKGNADESIEQEEYESMSEKIEEPKEEQEPEETTETEAETPTEVVLEKFKVSDSCHLSSI